METEASSSKPVEHQPTVSPAQEFRVIYSPSTSLVDVKDALSKYLKHAETVIKKNPSHAETPLLKTLCDDLQLFLQDGTEGLDPEESLKEWVENFQYVSIIPGLKRLVS